MFEMASTAANGIDRNSLLAEVSHGDKENEKF